MQKYWVYVIKHDSWEICKKNKSIYLYDNDIIPDVMKNDIVIFYVLGPTFQSNEFVGYCYLKTIFKPNKTENDIFDIQAEIKHTCFLKEKIKNTDELLAEFIDIFYDIKFITFKNRYLSEEPSLAPLKRKFGNKFIKHINEISRIEKDYEHHIPILMIPCKKFDHKKIKENFLEHYKYCDKCEKNNNNNTDFLNLMEKYKIPIEYVSKTLCDIDKYSVARKYRMGKHIVSVNYIQKHELYSKCFIISFSYKTDNE